MNKKIKLVFAQFFAMALPLFAAGDIVPRGMTTLAESILGIFTGRLVQVILAICLCGSAVMFAYNKDNERIKKSAIAVGIAAMVLMGASGIVGAIWSASGG